MHKSVLLLIFLFGFIMVISADKERGLLPTKGDEMIQHPLMPNILLRRRYIRSFAQNTDSLRVPYDCCLKCLRTCECCYA